ncbi:MAG: MaoC family dehydratase [Proteobacteria bacterium]|nr:MaoC family dehydratase [Pseudomonadota bacterium]
MKSKHGYYFEDLSTGMSESYTRTVSDKDIRQFAEVSGDTNPLHLDEEFAATTRFKKRIAHGMLSGSYISTIVGTRLPGPGCLYRSQTLKFRAPVHIDDEVTASVTITELDERRGLVTLNTVCRVGDTDVIRGEAVMLVPRRN